MTLFQSAGRVIEPTVVIRALLGRITTFRTAGSNLNAVETRIFNLGKWYVD